MKYLTCTAYSVKQASGQTIRFAYGARAGYPQYTAAVLGLAACHPCPNRLYGVLASIPGANRLNNNKYNLAGYYMPLFETILYAGSHGCITVLLLYLLILHPGKHFRIQSFNGITALFTVFAPAFNQVNAFKNRVGKGGGIGFTFTGNIKSYTMVW